MTTTIDLSALQRQAELMSRRANSAKQVKSRLVTFLQRRLPPEAKRDISAQYNLRPSRIAQGLNTRNASDGVELTATSRGVNLIEFGAKQNSTGVVATVESAKGAREVPHGFIATAKNGKLLVFLRKVIGGKRAGRLPLSGAFGPSVADMLRNGDREERLTDFAQEGASKEVARLLELSDG